MQEENEADNDKVFRILIVDDDKDVLDELHRTLERTDRYSADIVSVENSDLAFAELKKKEFDLVLADYKMPGMNGVELLSIVKEQYPGTIRILITGYSDINIAKEAINWADVHNYIEKPWDNEELRLTIHEALLRKHERESTKIEVFERVKDAMVLMDEFQENLIAIPAEHVSKQVIMLQFNSAQEFNKFSFAIKSLKSAQIVDVQIFEDKHIISLVIHPEKYAYLTRPG